MSRSAFVEVNITNPTRLAQDSQDTANKAVKGVENLSDPNVMNVIEKQYNIAQFAGLTSQYNVLVQNAKDDGIDTTAVTTAYNNLNKFMADVLADPDHASDVDRATYKNYQDAYNKELAKLQNALQNNTNDKFTSAASALSQAASTANVAKSAADSTYAYANSEIAVQSTATAKAQSTADGAFSQAQVVGSQADSAIAVQSTATSKAQSAADNAFSEAQSIGSQSSSEIAVQSNATAKAQSTADSAFSQAVTAIDTGKATSQAVTDLKDGSKLTIAELENGLATKVANSDYASYKEQTASQIGQLVTNGAFSAYQTQTADLIAQKVATSDFSAYQATTAKSIDSKVESSDFNTYKTQTDDLISQTVTEAVSNISVGGRNIVLNSDNMGSFHIWTQDGNFQFSDDKKEITVTTSHGGINIYKTNLSGYLPNNGDTVVISADVKGNSHLQFNYSDGNVFVSSGTNIAVTTEYKRYFTTFEWNPVNLDKSEFVIFAVGNAGQYLTVKNVKVEIGNKATDWTPAPEDQATQSQITQLSGDIEQKVDSGDFSTYKTQTASLIAEKVANSDFTTYQKQTADLISAKVETKDFSSYKDETAKSIDSMVKSKDFESYKTQTASMIDSKVSNSNYTSDMKQMAGQIEDKVSNGTFTSYKTETANLIGSKVSNGDFTTYKTQTAGLISAKVETKDFSSYKDETAKAISSKVESKDFNSYKAQTPDLISQTVSAAVNDIEIGSRNLVLNSNDLSSFGVWTQDGGTKLSEDKKEITITSSHGGINIFRKSISNELPANGDTVVISADIKGNSHIQFNYNDGIAFVGGGTSIPATSEYKRYSTTFKWSSANVNNIDFVIYTTGSSDQFLTVKNVKIEIGNKATDWSPAPEDLATQSQFTQLSGDINLRVTKGDLISQINIQARNTLISSGGQLTLSGKNVFIDSNDPVIMKSANIDKLLVGKKLTAADIAANTFTTNNGTFTVKQDGSVTAKSMTLIGGTLTSPTINASTINGGTLNMQTDGLINSPYNGIQQTADQFYHPWKLNTGQLTIGQGYITSVSSGTRSINGVPKQFDSLQGTLSASYLKFTNNYGARTYIDADMFTYSNQTNDTAMVKIDADGIGIDMGTANAPALTISNGYIDASSSSSYGTFGAITLGYAAHTVNSDSSIFFESGHGSGNPGINIWAKGFQSISSRLSTKRQVRLLNDEHSNSLLLGADTATFKYNQDTNADNSNEGVIIDDVNTTKQYSLPDELITRDGKAPTDLMSFIARIISQNKYQARLIENLQIRLRKVEIKNE